MDNNDFDWVNTGDLRVGHFVALDMGWMEHPFPSSNFKISNDKQLAAVRALGLARVRTVPAKSDPVRDQPLLVPSPAPLAEPVERSPTRRLGNERISLLAAQRSSALNCERRFAESIQVYRKTLDLAQSNPVGAADLCRTQVTSLVSDMMKSGESAIRLISEAVGDRGAMHPVNVTLLALLLGKSMGLEPPALQDLGLAAYLHDVGKIDIPERSRVFDEDFSDSQRKLYQEHVTHSLRIANSMRLPEPVQQVISQHHELADGSGFPGGLSGAAISVSGRILSLVNRFDNLCNPAKSGAAMTPHEALAQLYARHKNRFDPLVLSAFIRMMGVYPPGSVVQLVDERYALVVSVNPTQPLKPRVVVFDTAVAQDEALIIDLKRSPALGIRRSLKPANLSAAALDYLAPRQRICYFFEHTDANLEEAPAVD